MDMRHARGADGKRGVEMTRTALVIVIATISVLILAGVSRFLDAREIKDLKDRLSAQQIEAAATDVLIEQVRQQAAADSANRDSVTGMYAALRDSLTEAGEATTAATVRVEAVRATIDEEALTPKVRELLAAERAVCTACAKERDIARTLADSLESDLRLIRPRLDAARTLLFKVQGERDDALELSGDAIERLQPNFFQVLFGEIPQMMACAGGGALAATIYDGNALVGAGIGLAACLIKEAIF